MKQNIGSDKAAKCMMLALALTTYAGFSTDRLMMHFDSPKSSISRRFEQLAA